MVAILGPFSAHFQTHFWLIFVYLAEKQTKSDVKNGYHDQPGKEISEKWSKNAFSPSGTLSVSKSGSRNRKKTGTELDRTAKSQTRQLQFRVFGNKKPHATACNQVGSSRLQPVHDTPNKCAHFEPILRTNGPELQVYSWFEPVWTGFFFGFNWKQLQLVRTGSDRFFVVPVRFFWYFRIRQPVAVAVRPKMAKKPDRTGL
jgi:hypothetical protein